MHEVTVSSKVTVSAETVVEGNDQGNVTNHKEIFVKLQYTLNRTPI